MLFASEKISRYLFLGEIINYDILRLNVMQSILKRLNKCDYWAKHIHDIETFVRNKTTLSVSIEFSV